MLSPIKSREITRMRLATFTMQALSEPGYEASRTDVLYPSQGSTLALVYPFYQWKFKRARIEILVRTYYAIGTGDLPSTLHGC